MQLYVIIFWKSVMVFVFFSIDFQLFFLFSTPQPLED